MAQPKATTTVDNRSLASRFAGLHGAPGVKRSQGFSLLEVLVAFTITALLLTVLFQTFASGLRAARLSETYTHAILLAQGKLAELSVEETLVEGAQEGNFDDTYRWQTQITPYLLADEPEDIQLPVRPFTTTVEVYWNEGAQQRSIALTTLLLTGQSSP